MFVIAFHCRPGSVLAVSLLCVRHRAQSLRCVCVCVRTRVCVHVVCTSVGVGVGVGRVLICDPQCSSPSGDYAAPPLLSSALWVRPQGWHPEVPAAWKGRCFLLVTRCLCVSRGKEGLEGKAPNSLFQSILCCSHLSHELLCRKSPGFLSMVRPQEGVSQHYVLKMVLELLERNSCPDCASDTSACCTEESRAGGPPDKLRSSRSFAGEVGGGQRGAAP